MIKITVWNEFKHEKEIEAIHRVTRREFMVVLPASWRRSRISK